MTLIYSSEVSAKLQIAKIYKKMQKKKQKQTNPKVLSVQCKLGFRIFI